MKELKKVLLIQSPFFSIETPSIGLEMIRASLERSNVQCEVAYINLQFAELVGHRQYQEIHERVPQQMLLGDLIFSEALNGKRVSDECLVGLAERQGGRASRSEILPDDLLYSFQHLQSAATKFCADIVNDVDWREYLFVGFGTIFQLAPALALSRAIKKTYDATAIVFGGSQCEGIMGQTIHEQFPWVDFVCRGEGERFAPALVDQLCGERKFATVQGLIWRRNGNSVSNGENALGYTDLDELPVPHYDKWISETACKPWAGSKKLRLPFETSRGCWYGEKSHCTFCGLNGLNLAYRRKSPERALLEFEALRTTGIKSISATDNILDFRFFKTFLPALAQLGHDCALFYEVKSNLNFQQMVQLREAGVAWIQPGIESLSTNVLCLMKKGVTALQNVRLLRWAAELNIGVAWNILYGFPGERVEDYVNMAGLIPLLEHLPPPLFSCNRVRLDRFSPLYNDAASDAECRISPCAAYRQVFDLPDSILHKLAYYFDPSVDRSDLVEPMIAPVREAVLRWHAEAGRSSFVALKFDDYVELCDTRRVAREPCGRLDGFALRVYNTISGGKSAREVAQVLNASESEVSVILRDFGRKAWVVELDERVIPLAVPFDGSLFNDVPDGLRGGVALALYADRMKRMRELLVSDRGEASKEGRS